MIDRKKIFADYKTIKNRVIRYFKNNEFEKCLATIESAVLLANSFNLFYVDEDIEGIICQIGEKYNISIPDRKDKEEQIIFFDSFGLDNRGLTQQYIRALIFHKIKFVYILAKDGSSNIGPNILEELNAYENAEIIIISHKCTRLEKIAQLSKIIGDIAPTKIFTHRTPWDTVGNAVFSNIINIKSVEVFHINLTDHAFWLGKNAAHYFIEFRSYGANISIDERKIEKEKLLLLPYYPIVSNIPFEGFPADIKNDSVILFTGSTYYKMYGENGKFFSLVKKILDENQNTTLLIAGGGEKEPLVDFINTNHFQERILLLGDRRDINNVFKNIDIYLATYPITGGLMGQYAALNHKPIVAYTDPELSCNIVEEFVATKDYKITYFDEQSYLQEVKNLVSDVAYRNIVSEKVAKAIVTPETFNQNFYSVVFNKTLIQPFNVYSVNIDRFANIYLNVENNYVKSYDGILYRYFKNAGKIVELKYYPAVLRYIIKALVKKINL